MIAAVLLAASLWTPGEIASARHAIDAALAAPTLRGAHIGLLAVDAGTGELLYDRNAGDAFTPASTFKLLVGSAALARLGPAFTFVTEVDATGSTLVLRGGGDARLSARDIGMAAQAVAATGIKHFDTLAGDATRYNAERYPGGWSIDDLPYDYAAIPSALSLEENVVHAAVTPGDAAGSSTGLVTAPVTDVVAIKNDTTTGARGSEDTTDVARPWDQPEVIQLVGSVPLGVKISDDLQPAVPDPPAYALDVFRLDLIQDGIDVGTSTQAQYTPPPATTTLWRHASEPLSKTLGLFWQPSDNLIAEQLLLELGASSPTAATERAKIGTRGSGYKVEQAWLQSIGVDPRTVTIFDGSGLSEYDRITPNALVAILKYDWNGPNRQTVLDALPLAGVRGTLKSSFGGTSLRGNLYAKTGTINHARTLAGFLKTPHHGTVAFALTINDWMDASPDASEAIARVQAAVLEALRPDASGGARPAF
jgi:D-alanyl-D-alanine carboxypeptidase/D-alanyl-D-alanine-endopeptidase (penicillin-binding protein 4)